MSKQSYIIYHLPFGFIETDKKKKGSKSILIQASWAWGVGVFMLTKKLSKLLIWETMNVNDQKECHRGFVYIFKTVHKNYL